MMVLVTCLLNPAAVKKILGDFWGFYKFYVGDWFFTYNMYVKKKVDFILQFFIFQSGDLT